MRLTSCVLALLPLALAIAGCVTRTVYVVDDDARPPPASPPASLPGPGAAPSARAEAADPAPSDGSPMEPEAAAGIQDESDFYEPLSPYGSWVAYPDYGRVFVPASAVVGVGFRPYTHGHWEHTEWGYTWVDHHPFGWATGHYGRWFYDSSYGWVWVPGRVWAPAWVSWRSGGGYVGWAPMPPGAIFGGAYSVYESSWVFTSYSGFGGGYVGSALIIGPAYGTCYYATYPARETYVVYGRSTYRGPDENELVRGGGRVVHRPVRDVERERAVTRPPEGTTISRQRSRTNANGPSSSGRDEERAAADDGARGSERSRTDERATGRDDGARSSQRGSRDDANGVKNGRDDDRSAVGDARSSPLNDVRDQAVDPRATPVAPARDARADLGDGRGPLSPPKSGGESGDPGARDDERPVFDSRAPTVNERGQVEQKPANPDAIRPITARPDAGRPSTRTLPAPALGSSRSPVAPRAAVLPPATRGSEEGDRSPARPVAPSVSRATSPSRAPAVAPLPSRGPAVSEPVAQPTPAAQPTTSSKKKKGAKSTTKATAKP